MSRERTDEEVKRLAPKQEILRELYIKSGNECAYPGCHNVLVDENGKFVGYILHKGMKYYICFSIIAYT